MIIKVTSTTICGFNLHIYLGSVPTHRDYVIGHEPMGIVEEVGSSVTRIKKGDRVIIPFNLSCGDCFYCDHAMESQCDNSNRNPHIDTGGYLGFTERYGNYPGGKPNIYAFVSEILRLSAFQNHVNFPTKLSFLSDVYRPLIGVWKTLELKKVTQ